MVGEPSEVNVAGQAGARHHTAIGNHAAHAKARAKANDSPLICRTVHQGRQGHDNVVADIVVPLSALVNGAKMRGLSLASARALAWAAWLPIAVWWRAPAWPATFRLRSRRPSHWPLAAMASSLVFKTRQHRLMRCHFSSTTTTSKLFRLGQTLARPIPTSYSTRAPRWQPAYRGQQQHQLRD